MAIRKISRETIVVSLCVATSVVMLVGAGMKFADTEKKIQDENARVEKLLSRTQTISGDKYGNTTTLEVAYTETQGNYVLYTVEVEGELYTYSEKNGNANATNLTLYKVDESDLTTWTILSAH